MVFIILSRFYLPRLFINSTKNKSLPFKVILNATNSAPLHALKRLSSTSLRSDRTAIKTSPPYFLYLLGSTESGGETLLTYPIYTRCNMGLQ